MYRSYSEYGIGNMGATGIGGLPQVSDPEQTFANITRDEYLDYIRDYRDFEQEQIDLAQTDTSLIDQAREDAPEASRLSQEVQNRSISRYGGQLTPAQRQQMEATQQRSSQLGFVNALSNARIAQREANTALLSDLINIGQGVNRASQQQLGSAAQDANARRNAYTQAKASSRAQTYSTIGSIGGAALAFLAI